MTQMYSYIRWSSDRQELGTTLQRQITGAKEFAIQQGLELVEVIDAGVSAFKGKNTTDGKLGDFIAAVEAKAIPSDSWLYVENLDRLTRQEVTTAQELFLKLLRLGLTVVTGMDKRVYTIESVNQNPTDLMLSILLFSRANEESKTKQARTIGNVETLIERHKKGEPVNIKSAGKHPFWVDDSGSQYEAIKPHPKYWQIAREALDMFLEGHGIYKVKRYLDDQYPNELNGKEWDYQVIKRMRESRALIGERTLNVQKRTYILENYYPALCKSESEFLRLQELRVQNGHKSKRDPNKDNIKLMSGLSILRCARCKGTMHGYLNKGKPRYICVNGKHKQKGCSAWSVTAPLVEQCIIICLLMEYLDSSRDTSQNVSDIESAIASKQNLLETCSNKVKNLVSLVENGVGNISELSDRLIELGKERDGLIKQISNLSDKKILMEGKGSFEDTMIDFIGMIRWDTFNDITDESRNKIRNNISSIVETVFLDKIDGCLSIKVKCIGSDIIYVFTGDMMKPQWKFYTEHYVDGESYLVSTNDDLLSHEKMKTIIKTEKEIQNTYQKYLKTVMGLLSTVGYPEINGSAFWPNR
ncbi:recombinase family protein [Aeromonas rivuli]|uniref:recombinase family protein n=1 Tax=Aeromonas rivuli TaxID=648794 RepID=UPI0005AA2FE0|nr:recombinase family protein [Aeromonas rivuli]